MTAINIPSVPFDIPARTVDFDDILEAKAAADDINNLLPTYTTLRDETEAAAASAAAFAATSEWVSGESYTKGDLVWSPATGETFRALTTHSGVTTDPSEDDTNWIAVLRQGVLYLDGGTMAGPLALKSVSGTLAEPNAGVIDLSAGTAFSIALGGAIDFSLANVPAGPWSVTLRLSASGAQAPVYPATWLWADPGKPADLDDGETLVISLRGDGGPDGFVYAAVQWRGDTSLSGLFFADSRDGAALKMHDHGLADRLFTDAGTTPAEFGDCVQQIIGLTPPGRNATQATQASRPRAVRQPVGGARNLIARAGTASQRHSEDFSKWVRNTSQTTLEQVAGKGHFAQGWRFRDTDAAQNPSLSITMTSAITPGKHIFGVFFSYDHDSPPSNGRSLFSLQGTTNASVRVIWNANGTVASVSAGSGSTDFVDYEDLGNGLYFAWARADFAGDGTTVIAYVWAADFVGGGTSTGGVIIYGATVEKANTAPGAYQRVSANGYHVFEEGQRHVSGVEWNGATESVVIGPFAEGFTGDVAFITPSGIWIEESVTVASAGNLTLGPVNGPGGTADFFVDYPRSVAVIPLEDGFTAADIARLQAFAAGLGLPNTILSGV